MLRHKIDGVISEFPGNHLRGEYSECSAHQSRHNLYCTRFCGADGNLIVRGLLINALSAFACSGEMCSGPGAIVSPMLNRLRLADV